MASIQFISTSTIRPASHIESTQRIELTPWDLQLLLVDSIQKGLLFHKPTLPQETQEVIHHLKNSLSLTLDFFSPLAGRLATTNHNDNTTSFFIECNGAGAEFIHAVADGVTVAHITKSIYTPRIVHSFFPLNGVLNIEGTSKSLLAIQVTELIDGIFIACTMNHMVVDGTSFWHFFNSWSEISRTNSNHVLSNPPILQRWFLDHSPNNCLHLSQEDLKQPIKSFIPLIPPPILQERVFHFTKEKIVLLKAKANAEMGTHKISSLQALLAHFWRAVIRNRRHLKYDQEIIYRLLVGIRPRLNPPLPSHYFGNAVQTGTVTIKTGELLDDEQGLGYAAWQMNKMVALQTDETVRDFLKSWIKSPKLLTVGNTITENALLTGSSPRFNVYGNDFGWGSPVAVRSGAGNKSDGKITVFAGVEEGSVDIEACLKVETLEAMGDDAEFMEAVSIFSGEQEKTKMEPDLAF